MSCALFNSMTSILILLVYGKTKTEAGNREIPLHSALLSFISKLQSQSTENYLITQLSRISTVIAKMLFGRFKTKAGFDCTL